MFGVVHSIVEPPVRLTKRWANFALLVGSLTSNLLGKCVCVCVVPQTLNIFCRGKSHTDGLLFCIVWTFAMPALFLKEARVMIVIPC